MQKNHFEDQIIGDKRKGVLRRRRVAMAEEQVKFCLLYEVEPKIVTKACKDENWIKSMEEELRQIEKNQTWELVPRPTKNNVIGTKWVFKKKLNENGEVIRNKVRLVCKGYS